MISDNADFKTPGGVAKKETVHAIKHTLPLELSKMESAISNNMAAPSGYKPIIGILTQPISEKKRKSGVIEKQYILQMNDDFIKWGGSRSIAIPYDISKEDLKILLPQINGAFFTGGSVDLVDKKTKKPHKYYETAKSIYEYSKQVKDTKGENWPVYGVCQGL